jgi:predicted nucleotidyltransferase
LATKHFALSLLHAILVKYTMAVPLSRTDLSDRELPRERSLDATRELLAGAIHNHTPPRYFATILGKDADAYESSGADGVKHVVKSGSPIAAGPKKPLGDFDELEKRLHADWGHLKHAREFAATTREELRLALKDLDSEDTSIVVSGSLARDEFTLGSDIDWTLLIDGSADPKHYDLTKKIGDVISRIAKKPVGRERTFGAMVFSHDLVHQIGGEDDTNLNTTRRLLLLLESRAVGRQEAYKRVVRNVLSRYLLEDRGFWRGSGHRVPRFLQNDFARYWRTMAADFAYKLRTRSGKGWAIRNTKLRMSRKLIYVSGLLACYRCHLDYSDKDRQLIFGEVKRRPEVIEHLERIFQLTPLEILASVLVRYPHLDDAGQMILNSYDGFVSILEDEKQRTHLEDLKEEDADADALYQHARKLSHTFRDGLLAVFFDQKSELDLLTKNYGVF